MTYLKALLVGVVTGAATTVVGTIGWVWLGLRVDLLRQAGGSAVYESQPEALLMALVGFVVGAGWTLWRSHRLRRLV
jgi:hypothetical protein